MNANISRTKSAHFVVPPDAGEDTHAEDIDLFPRQRRHGSVHEVMIMRTMRTCCAHIFTQAAPGVVRELLRNAWSVALIACLLCVPETALAQGGNFGEGPGWMPILLGIWLGVALIFGTFSVIPLKRLKRRHPSFGLKKAVVVAYLLPLLSSLMALAAAEYSDSEILMFLVTIGVIQLIYIGIVWLFSSLRGDFLRTEKKGVTSQSE